MKRLLITLLAAALLAGAVHTASAQSGTPEIVLATPVAGDCTVDPRTTDELQALVDSTGNATPELALETPNADAATPTPFVAPEGTPITEGETFDEVGVVVTQFYACQNANDTMRMFALMTDDYVVRTVTEGNIDPADYDNAGTPSTDMVATDQDTIALNGIVEVEAGVYGVNVVGVDGANGEEFTDYVVVIQTDDGYLIDDVLRLG